MESGRCFYCGSEDVEYLADGTKYCCECGTEWGSPRPQYRQQRVRQNNYRRNRVNPDFSQQMAEYRRKKALGLLPPQKPAPQKPISKEELMQSFGLAALISAMAALLIGFIGKPIFMLFFHLPFCDDFLCSHSFTMGWLGLFITFAICMFILSITFWSEYEDAKPKVEKKPIANFADSSNSNKNINDNKEDPPLMTKREKKVFSGVVIFLFGLMGFVIFLSIPKHVYEEGTKERRIEDEFKKIHPNSKLDSVSFAEKFSSFEMRKGIISKRDSVVAITSRFNNPDLVDFFVYGTTDFLNSANSFAYNDSTIYYRIYSNNPNSLYACFSTEQGFYICDYKQKPGFYYKRDEINFWFNHNYKALKGLLKYDSLQLASERDRRIQEKKIEEEKAKKEEARQLALKAPMEKRSEGGEVNINSSGNAPRKKVSGGRKVYFAAESYAFHSSAGCTSLRRSSWIGSKPINEARAEGMVACKLCW